MDNFDNPEFWRGIELASAGQLSNREARREAFVSFVKIDATVATVETSSSRKVFDNRQGRQLVLTLERRARSTVRRGALRSEMIHQIHQDHRVH